MKNADMPAMPQYGKFDDNSKGLTKREYFAAMAMQGLLSFYGDGQSFEMTAKESVKTADALLTELESTQ